MGEQQKRVNNPLFSASVTGSTFEEYSQRAMIFPAQEVASPPQATSTSPLVTAPGMKYLFIQNLEKTHFIKILRTIF